VRAQEEAAQELALATTAMQAAEQRLQQINRAPLTADVQMTVRSPQGGMLRQVLAMPGQSVNAGAPLFEVVDLAEMWVRVPIYAGETAMIVANTPVTVQTLSGVGPSWTAQPVVAPPSADPTSSTVHYYYRLSNEGRRFKPGEKVTVTMRATGTRNWIEVPWSAVVFDTRGGNWVYESRGDRHYSRHRVDVDHVTSGIAYLSAGIPQGMKVVTEGAAELWGFEFGTGK
jgi:multidrug efflux pump subunit AcrA (membrane-fusion protein)